MTELSVREFLSSIPANERIHYRANPGNAGDSLIACGAFKLFKESNIDYDLVDPLTFKGERKTIFYAGGGNLVGLYPHSREFFRTFHKSAQRLVLLPHTVAKNEDLLSELGSNVTIFARERLSYEHLKKFAKKAEIFLDNDLAFNLTANDFLKMKPISFLEASVAKCFYKLSSNKQEADKIPSPILMLKNSVFEYKTQLSTNRNAASFRDDDEKLVSIDARGNADLSSIYNYDTRNPQLCTYAAQRLFKHINRFDTIRTDRLHVCIAAALLNKQVEFFPNSYFKCKAVFEYSLKGNFPNVKWMGD